MLTQPQVQRYSADSGLRDIMIAEKEVVLTFLLQLLSERGILNRLAFKDGTCLRKMIIGSQGRFSTDLDFTGTEEHDHEDNQQVLLPGAAFDSVEHHGLPGPPRAVSRLSILSRTRASTCIRTGRELRHWRLTSRRFRLPRECSRWVREPSDRGWHRACKPMTRGPEGQ